MDKCPFCGEIEIGYCTNPPGKHYQCGTWKYDGDWKERTNICYKGEITNLKERLEAWRELYKDYPWKNNKCINKLKDLGEI